ncbi:hypothetical protein RU97_GL001327 [Enterococcus canis]|uniref:Uncharacterized protein n=1 Tax=Enterococcus canis TaxID=214095 RepID=A0A1L8RG06_9ENTE|nr:PRD domain-containing protein [Enterococcus canis]OJG18709.1 hypothetical protein RU97_GL001327 [Enterococcus canis]
MEKTTELLTLLLEAEGIITSKQVALQLGVSAKTVRHYVALLQEEGAANGFQISSKKGQGLALQVTDATKFHQLRQRVAEPVENLLDQLMEGFIQQEGYLRAEEVCEELFISQSKLSQLLKELRKILGYYDLTIVSKPHYGMKIEGSEFNFRRFLASNYVQAYRATDKQLAYPASDATSGLLEAIKTVISEEFLRHAYPISENILHNLADHLEIAVLRMKEGMYLEGVPITASTTEDQRRLAECIVERLEMVCQVHFSENELAYVIGQIVGKRMLEKNQTKIVSEEVNRLVDQVLRVIEKQKGIDLLHDLDLRTMLMLHLAPLLDRLELGIELKNPLLDEVKIQCIFAYDVAIIAGQRIQEHSGKALSDHELSYLAMHFEVALNRQTEIQPKRILVVSHNGRSSGELLKAKFERYFPAHIETLTVCDLTDYEAYLANEPVDFLFTTETLNYQGTIPVFSFEFFLQPATVRKIEEVLTAELTPEQLRTYFDEDLYFPECSFKDREAVLDFLCREVRAKYRLPADFEALIQEREGYFGTDLMPQVALPHPNQLVAPVTKVCVLTLKKAIRWYKNPVRLVVLMLINKEDALKSKPLTERLIQRCGDPARLEKLLAAENVAAFVKEMEEE